MDEDELASLNAEPSEDTTPVNPIMIAPLPLQRQVGTSLPAAVTSTVMAQMAFEDGAVMPHQQSQKLVRKAFRYLPRLEPARKCR